HHRQCNDIGTIKIPNWLRAFTGNRVGIETCSGAEFPEDLSKYKVILHCGGCMLSEREIQYRMNCALDQQVPFTNYGLTIAHIQGILARSLRLFPALEEKIAD
ncbi:MAG: [FeFe] hydrogenase H-cluster maturation GTPase HydF, partial [Clostridiaceae bacterium]|nr:[FeFe] hydrogenase H-cluster maturation GTPase HydF [Clostridiaceae bacterium]